MVSVTTEVNQDTARLHRWLEWLSHLSCPSLEHYAWSMAQRSGPAPIVRPNEKRHMYDDSAPVPLAISSVANVEQHCTATTSEHDAEDARHHLPPPISYPPLPNSLAPTTTPEEAAAAMFANRKDFMGFLVKPRAFDAMIAAGRQPFWVWKNLPDTYGSGHFML